jgi:hypothetical protein
MTSVAYKLPVGLERKRVVLVQPLLKSIVAGPSIVKRVPNTWVRRLVIAMRGFKAIAGSLIVSVAMAESPALAAKSLRHDANWYFCDQNAAPCSRSIVGTCVPSSNCTPRAHVPKPVQDDDWPANTILGGADHSIGSLTTLRLRPFSLRRGWGNSDPG